MMFWALIRALVRFFFIFFFVLLYSLLNLLNFLSFVLKIRLIIVDFSALNYTFAMIRLMIPFVTIYFLIFRTSRKYILCSILQCLKILFNQGFKLISFLFFILFEDISLLQIWTCSILCYFNIVIYFLSTKLWWSRLSILIYLRLIVLLSSYRCFRSCFSHLINTLESANFSSAFILIRFISTNSSSLFVWSNSCTSSSVYYYLSLFFSISFLLLELIECLEISFQTLWAGAIRISYARKWSIKKLAFAISIWRLFLDHLDSFLRSFSCLHAVRK
jgi:hypothetical protein